MAKAKSDNLRKAKEKKNDEFYTRLEDIEAEISQHEDYVKHFQGKTVFCNCDDPEWSNFFVFFKLHFKQLGLKKLITTHYNMDGSPSYKMEWCGEMLGDDMVNLIKTPLEGNGDFRSDECIEILKESDIIVTNPPFSIAREDFIPMLYKYNKKFVIIGDLNWVAYKTVFPLFKDNKMFFGYTTVKEFKTPNGTMQKFGNKTWFTNLDLDKSHEPLILTKNYKGNESRYPKYDNYDAIECGKVKDIPKDYFPCWYKCPHAAICEYAKTEGKEKDKALCELASNGEIGVPITYMSQHCSEQFEVVGDDTNLANPQPLDNGKTGNGRFYVTRERERTTLHQNCHSQDAESVTELSESQSHYCQNSVQNNSESLVQEQATGQKRSESERIIEDAQIYLSQLMVNNPVLTIESLFKECKKCNGLIGCPITFLAEYCDEQFKIIGIGSDVPKTMEHVAYKDKGIICYERNGVAIYTYPYTVSERKVGNSLRIIENGIPKATPYNRIIIQRKQEKENKS